MSERSGYVLKKKQKSKASFIFKLLFILIMFFVICAYAYFFPKTMELLDKSLNEAASKTGLEINFDFFEKLSDFSKETVNKALYYAEIIEYNLKDILPEYKPVSLCLVSCAADFPLEEMNITSAFGRRKDPITNLSDGHTGIDIAAAKGDNVFSAWPGKVFETGSDKIYGNYVILEHSKDFFTKYCHLSKITCEKGEFMNAEEIIGEAGNSGRTTGSHLHFEVIIEGRNIDPMECFEL